ncbi:hypothetical protein Bca4012_065142 [Brassica carinata]
MLLLDTNVTLMPATVAASRVPTFDYSLLIRFGGECFRFRSQSELLALASTSSQLLDIMGRSRRLRVLSVTLRRRRLFLNATSETHIYFDKENNEERSSSTSKYHDDCQCIPSQVDTIDMSWSSIKKSVRRVNVVFTGQYQRNM